MTPPDEVPPEPTPDATPKPNPEPNPEPTPDPAPDPTPPSKRSRSPLDVGLLDDLRLGGEILVTAQKPEYVDLLAGQGIDNAFFEEFSGVIVLATHLATEATGKSTSKTHETVVEADAKKALGTVINAVRNRVKISYPIRDPRRADYYIGQNIKRSRTVLESAAATMIGHLTEKPPKTALPGDAAALTAALEAYKASQSRQAGDQSKASQAREAFEIKVKKVRELRRAIQYAVEALWPVGNVGAAAIRTEFGVPPDRPLP